MEKENIHNLLAIPKLQYLLHTSLCFKSSTLQRHDNVLGSIVSNVVNIHLYSEDPSWTQATLPVDIGGLGICSAVSFAPSAFLASSNSSADLVRAILPSSLVSLPVQKIQ